MIAKFFVERPVLANVIALVTMLLGAVALFNLPVAQYPPITPPTIQVTASYPGADPKTLVNSVALPIEQQVNGVENMLYMQSTCTADGRYTLVITFAVGTDLDFAQVLVQNRVSAAQAQLPPVVQQQGVVTKKKSTSILQIITLTAPDNEYDALFLSNYATLKLHDRLVRVPGVSDATVFGVGEYSMRIWLDPEKMRQRSLTPDDVISAIQKQNIHVAAGQLNMAPSPPGRDREMVINVDGDLDTVEQFNDVVLKWDTAQAGAITRIRDVGRVEFGARSYSQFFKLDGKVAGGLAIFQLPEANALDTAQRVQAAMQDLGQDFPKGLTYSIPFDTTVFVRASVNEVYRTLLEAGLMVLIVIIVFLQDWRASLVPATTVPVTIIGAFAAMAVMGFSVNLLTLFAIVLAIGIVVDDAIVVVEGVAQHIERGESPKEGSIRAMKELFGPIIGITLVLMAVFVPPAFMPGITGQMYRQFALVIAATALISAINALTLKPTQCALWLRPVDRNKKKNFFFRGFNWAYERAERLYLRLIGAMVARSGTMSLIALALIGLAIWGLTRVPTAFIPTEDQGYAILTVQLPDGASLRRTEEVMDELASLCRKNSAIEHVIVIGGMSPLDSNASLANAGIIYLLFKDWSQRGKGQDLLSIYNDLNARLSGYQAAQTMVMVPPPIQGLGLSGGFQMQLLSTDASYDFARLETAANQVIAKASANPNIRRVLTSCRGSVPQITVDLDTTHADALGVNAGDAYNAVQPYLGSSFVNQFTKFGRNYMVYAQADTSYRLAPEDIGQYFVRNGGGDMVPIGSVAKIHSAQGPALITLYNLFPSATINGGAKTGISSGEALHTMEDIARRTLPTGMTYQWTAMSYQEKLVGNSIYYILGLAVLLVYFVLAGQYESWITPAAVLLAVPLALLGTVGALAGLGIANNVYVQIGLVLLIALSAKNAILIVEMAREGCASGMTAAEAALAASRVRFRPIVMTSFTFIFGVLPLILAGGAGAAARKTLGVAVASGMLASTCLAVLFVPCFYVTLQRFLDRKKKG